MMMMDKKLPSWQIENDSRSQQLYTVSLENHREKKSAEVINSVTPD